MDNLLAMHEGLKKRAGSCLKWDDFDYSTGMQLL